MLPVPLSLVSGQVRQSTRGRCGIARRWTARCGQHKEPHRSWVHNLVPKQKSTLLPWTGVLKGGLGSTRGVVLGHLARTEMLGHPEQFGVARLLEDGTGVDG